MSTLLEKAKAQKTTKKVITNEHVDLAIAVLRGEVTVGQASTAMGYKQKGATQSYITLLRAAIVAHEQGKITSARKQLVARKHA